MSSSKEFIKSFIPIRKKVRDAIVFRAISGTKLDIDPPVSAPSKLAITRAGSSMLAELTNAHIPFISVPLPSSAEDHQLKNAIYYKKKDFGFLIEEKDLNSDLLDFIQQINKNRSILSRIIQNQSQYSDKNVYNNIDLILEKIINEKN